MEFEKSRLERLKRTLYSRDENALPKEERSNVSPNQTVTPKDWGEKPSFAFSYEKNMAEKNNSFFNKFFIGSLVFFLCALAIAAFIFYGGWNMISSNNVDIQIVGPSSLASGEELDLNLSVVNNNHTKLDNVTLNVDYPQGTQSPVKGTTALVRDKIVLDTIDVGGVKNQPIKVLMFGQKGTVKTITFTLQYTVSGSNAVFSKTKTYDVTISSSPLLLTVDAPEQVNAGQKVTLSLDVTSNSDSVVQNALVKVTYPYGFTYETSSAKPIRDGVWNIGDLKNGDKKTLIITGTIIGQNGENKVFNVSVGTPDIPSGQDFTVELAGAQPTVQLTKSFFNLSIGDSSNTDALAYAFGQDVRLSLNWENTVPEKVVNNAIKISFSGNVFDPAGVSADAGFYHSVDSTISWDKNTTGALAALSPGQTGSVSFTLRPLSDPNTLRTIKNPHITIHTEMNGNRTSSDGSSISSTYDTTVKFTSSANLASQSFRTTGPFSNTGPIPPKAETESTYTVAWTMTNTNNDLKNVVITAMLPVNVTWKGKTSPSGEHITYDSDSRTITWSPGIVAAGVGYTLSPKIVYFQVGITPSLTDVGAPMNLLNTVSVSATDTYTNTPVSLQVSGPTTHFSDTNFSGSQDTVVK